jgi:hypothetical protein
MARPSSVDTRERAIIQIRSSKQVVPHQTVNLVPVLQIVTK